MTDAEVVLVTGASKGIGRHLVEHFVRRGAVVEGCSREPVDFELDRYTHHVADVSNEAHVKAVLTSIRSRHGRLDIAINNAGVGSMNLAMLTPASTVRRIMDVNMMGTFLVCRESAKLMQRRKYGRIVNVVSVAVPMRIAGEAVYAASKSAVETLTRIMSHEVGELGITCNAVGPTPIPTDLIRGVPKAKIDEVVARLAVKRLGRYEDVSNVVDFFVRPESDYVTGQVIYLGGA